MASIQRRILVLSQNRRESSPCDGAPSAIGGAGGALGGLETLAGEVARCCGFTFVPPVLLRRGIGGDWSYSRRAIRIGVKTLESASGGQEKLWHILAHELAHAQARNREGHTREFWRRLAEGLKRAGRLELLRHDIGYREGALRVAREYGLSNLPPVSSFRLDIGASFVDRQGRRWTVARRFRRGGTPWYRLKSPGWTWRASEETLLQEAGRALAGSGPPGADGPSAPA